jgi:hypothetical protein
MCVKQAAAAAAAAVPDAHARTKEGVGKARAAPSRDLRYEQGVREGGGV